ncbi:hypothetical protein BDV98DRAFT_584621 [Pterulicium gracile]|uniref:Uncharacterized protein n=1 Tax=Pterulicium gracile TaxID=1884261 RepID=A0A5C3QCD8_9AGAR|nr:hypothetical protein BDV98DRAFT_584621 [Pterula gracilis]
MGLGGPLGSVQDDLYTAIQANNGIPYLNNWATKALVTQYCLNMRKDARKKVFLILLHPANPTPPAQQNKIPRPHEGSERSKMLGMVTDLEFRMRTNLAMGKI